ncbi:discoidin domain-containing protein [Paenibacillus sp. FSL L8-0644]|uniref:NADase-type glycan-binding domain-containing protein n=1 Tax=Paenibacillus sp. FSL L8-0644 TaxID=2954523 RepID=UPI0030F9E94E
MNSRKRKKTAVWISKITLLVMIFSMLCGCIQSNEGQKVGQERNETYASVSQSKKPPPTKRAVNWLLFEAENENMPVDYLVDMDDPTGNTFIDTTDIIDRLYASEKEDFPRSELEIMRFSSDGKTIALSRYTHMIDYSAIFIYDLSTYKKLYEFNIPDREYVVISPDLSKCVYTNNGDFFQYNIQGRVTQKLSISNYTGSEESIGYSVFSPDSSKLCIEDNGTLYIFDLMANKEVQRITVTKAMQVYQWLYNNKIVYRSYDDEKWYMLNLDDGKKRMLAEFSENPVLTLDNHRVAYLNSKGEMQQRDIPTGLPIKYSNVFHRIGYNVSPTQWIQTTTDLMKYRKSIPAQKIVASSTLPDQAGNSYAARNIMDGDASTAWCEGVKGDGIGEWIKIDFGSMQELKGFELINGLAKSSKAFQANNRVKRMKLEFSNGQTMMIDNDFISNEFLDNPIHTSFVKIMIEAVERGSKYNDTCMSEIRFF